MPNFFYKWFSNIGTNIKLFFTNVLYGLKTAEDNTLKQIGRSEAQGTSIVQKKQTTNVYEAMLRGEVTQEVEDLRYSLYLTTEKAKEYVYFSPTLALKKSDMDNYDKKDYRYENSDGLELITSQLNLTFSDDLEQALENAKFVGSEEQEENISEYGDLSFLDKKSQYEFDVKKYMFEKGVDNLIKVERKGVARFKIENFVNRIDVKGLEDNRVVIDVFVSKYHNGTSPSKLFIKEVERGMRDISKFDVLDVEQISFTTQGAYLIKDNVTFVFRNIIAKKILEFDGNYIIRCNASVVTNYIDYVEKYYSERQAKRYETKEKKNSTLSFAEFVSQQDNTQIPEEQPQEDIDSQIDLFNRINDIKEEE